MSSSSYFKMKFKSLKKAIPMKLEYGGVKHNDLIKNIKDDVAFMEKIEKYPDAENFKKKIVYRSCIGRLDKILNKLLELENE